MLNALYRAIIIGRAKSTAEKIANQLSERQLNDIGHSRSSLISKSVEIVTKDLDEAQIKRNNQAIRYPKKPGLWVAYKYFHFGKTV